MPVRRFGYLVGCLLLVWGGWRFYTSGQRYFVLAGASGVAVLLLAQAKPEALAGFYRVWMLMAAALGWVMTRLILTVVFYGLLTPLGLGARLLGTRFLELEIDKACPSYWIWWDSEEEQVDERYCEKQY